MDFLTAKKGEPHFTSEQFRAMLTAICGTKTYITQLYNRFSPEIVTNNLIKINSGMLLHHGGLFLIDEGSYDEVNCKNGSQGMKRIDLIVVRYTKDASTGIENAEWVVIQGEEAASNPVAPEYIIGNMQNGDLTDDCPVFAVEYDGINIVAINTLVNCIGSIEEIGALSLLATKEKGSLVGALNELKEALGGLKFVAMPYSEYKSLNPPETNTFYITYK